MRDPVLILTPDPADALGDRLCRASLRQLLEALNGAGVPADPVAWTEAAPDRLAAAPLVMPLLVWGYARQYARWRAALDAWEAAGVRLRNPAPVLRWNCDKTYLGRLAEKGAPIVPTLFVEQVTQAAMEAAAARFGTARLVAKPTVSAGAVRTIRWEPGAAIDGGPAGRALIQPFLDSVIATGEVSMIYLDGAFSHAALKTPAAGDFRVQREWGGAARPFDPPAALRAAADRVIAAIGEPLLYARIDMVPDDAGHWLLIEAELAEPELFLPLSEGADARFAAAVARCLGSRTAAAGGGSGYGAAGFSASDGCAAR